MPEPRLRLDSAASEQSRRSGDPSARDDGTELESVPDTAFKAESAAESATVDAESAADLAGTSTAASQLAALSARVAARSSRIATAAAVAAAAVDAAEAAAAAATVVEDQALARAVDVAAAAVAAMEAVAADRDPDGDDVAADRAAADVAAIVAADVLAAEITTAAAADTVAAAVTVAAEAAAVAAQRAAIRAERDAFESLGATQTVVDSSTDAAAAVDLVVASTTKVAELTARLRVVTALRDSEQRFRVTFDNAAAGMMLASLAEEVSGRLLRVNPALRAITGREDTELLTLGFRDLFAEEDQPDQARLLADLAGGALTAHESDELWRHVSGRPLWVHVSVHAIREERGLPAYAVCHVEDITERRRAQEALRRREERFRQAFQNAMTGMAFLGLDRTLRKANSALAAFLGWSETELLGQHFEALASVGDQPSITAGIAGAIAGEFTTYEGEHGFLHADGRVVWGHVSAAVEQDLDGPEYLVVQVRDVSARRQADSLLSHQALHDELTGLANRALLAQHLDAALARAVRAQTHVAVLFIDVDDFKEINDSLGHVVGDDVLIEVASRLRACLRGFDLAARMGGDEFVVVCEGLDEPGQARDVARRIDRALSARLVTGTTEVHLSVSIGISTAPASDTPADLLRTADTAMYHAKTNGKDRYEVYDEGMSVRAIRHVKVAAELADALDRDELRLHYQPTYDLGTGEIEGVEALLRWQHPTRGLLRPAEFLDVAEGRRLMVPIGDWVIATAVTQASLWQHVFGDHAPDMWVNIAGQQLGRSHLTEVVERLLAATGLTPAKFGLEITERQLVGREDAVRADLLALQEIGLRMAIDDFGTGFASLEYLRRFSFDEIKIDQSFVSGLGTDRTDTAVTTSVIALGRSLDLVVVAEGVETTDQYRQLQALGCDLAQGYLLHRPAPADAIRELLVAATGR